MADDTPTPTGGETSHTVNSAAQALSGLLGAAKEQPPKEQAEQATEEATPTNEAQAEEGGETQEGTSEEQGTGEQEGDAQNEVTLETIDQLAEATGLPIETILNLRAKVKVDGSESEVPFGEVLKSYQLSKHVNSESQELANQRKAFEAERETKSKELTQRLTEAQALTQAMEQGLLAEYNGIDWTTLRNTDPAEFAARKQEYNERWQQIQQAKYHAVAQAQKLQQESQQKSEEELRKHISAEGERLLSVIPEWKDESKRNSDQAEIKSYLKSMGFNDQDMSAIVDHRQVRIIRNAMLYEKSTKQASLAQKKVVKLPPVLRPGAQPNKADVKRERSKEFKDKLRKTGHVRDAAKALEALIS